VYPPNTELALKRSREWWQRRGRKEKISKEKRARTLKSASWREEGRRKKEKKEEKKGKGLLWGVFPNACIHSHYPT
jgi:hypothetical protein